MTYLEARNSGYPFNRRKYKDGWYIRDLRRNVDYAMLDLSQRFWSEADLVADDWWTQPIADIEALIDEDKELMKTLQEMEKLDET
jgi:hypothetical protein